MTVKCICRRMLQRMAAIVLPIPGVCTGYLMFASLTTHCPSQFAMYMCKHLCVYAKHLFVHAEHNIHVEKTRDCNPQRQQLACSRDKPPSRVAFSSLSYSWLPSAAKQTPQ